MDTIIKEFLNGISQVEELEETNGFVRLMQNHVAPRVDFSILEVLDALDKKQTNGLWNDIVNQLNSIQKTEQLTDDQVAYLNAVGQFQLASMKRYKKGEAKLPQGFITSVQIVHDCLLADNLMMCPELQKLVSKVCEQYWTKNLLDQELVLPSTLLYLLMNAMDDDANKRDVNRVYKMREGFQAFDFEDESSDTLKHLLLRAMIHPLFLRNNEGRRFLAFVFNLDAQFVGTIHETIKQQLPYCKQSLLAHYGDVYFNAWRKSEGQLRITIELSCIQDLMHCGIHVANARTAKAALCVLHSFHENKRLKGVDEMLERLYAPILWRAMKVANSVVRLNAARILIDAFPIQNPEDSKKQTQLLLQRQFDQLMELLMDNDKQVRLVSIQGICRVLGVYWELLPVATAKKMLIKLVSGPACDASTSSIRAAVFEGLGFVLDNHLTHPLMKILLPQLSDLIFDKSESVQIAFLDLLIIISRIRSIQFFDIVSVDDMLLCLQHSTSDKVSSRVTSLLLPSYFPFNKANRKQLKRALSMIRSHPQAALTFFHQVHHNVPLLNMAKLIVNLFRALLEAAVHAEEQAERDSSHAKMNCASDQDVPEEEEKYDNSDEEEGKSRAKKRARRSKKSGPIIDIHNGSQVETVLGVILGLWYSAAGYAESSDQEFAEFTAYAVEAFEAGHLEDLLVMDHVNLSTNARVCLLQICALLPAHCSPNLSQDGVSSLARLSADAPVELFGPVLECLFAWDQHNLVIDQLNRSFAVAVGGTEMKTDSKTKGEKGKKAKRKHNKKNIDEEIMMDPVMAVRCYSYLMENARTRFVLLQPDNLHSFYSLDLQSVIGLLEKLMNMDVLQRAGDDLFHTQAHFALMALQELCKQHLHVFLRTDTEEDLNMMQLCDTMTRVAECVTTYAVDRVDVVSSDQEQQEEKETKKKKKKQRKITADDDTKKEADGKYMSLEERLVLFATQFFTELTTFGIGTNQDDIVNLSSVAKSVVNWTNGFIGRLSDLPKNSGKVKSKFLYRFISISLKLLFQQARFPYFAGVSSWPLSMDTHLSFSKPPADSSILFQTLSAILKLSCLFPSDDDGSLHAELGSALSETLKAAAGRKNNSKGNRNKKVKLALEVLLVAILNHFAYENNNNEMDFDETMQEVDVSDLAPVELILISSIIGSPSCAFSLPFVLRKWTAATSGPGDDELKQQLFQTIFHTLSSLAAVSEGRLARGPKREKFLQMMSDCAFQLSKRFSVNGDSSDIENEMDCNNEKNVADSDPSDKSHPSRQVDKLSASLHNLHLRFREQVDSL